jgi:hypothetical protein
VLSRALVKPTPWRAALAALCATTCALAGAAAAHDGSGCAKDTECKGSRICVNRVCVDPPPVVACTRDVDCPGDDVCVDKICGAAPGAGAAAPAKAAGSASKKKGAPPAAAAHAPAPVVPAPAPAPVPAPVETPTVLILASPPPAVSTPPAAAPAPAAAAPAPAFSPSTTPPASTPPAAASAAGGPVIRRVEESGFSPTWLYNVGVQGGLHRWGRADRSEGDFGLSASAEAGLRLSDHLGFVALGSGSWTLMAESPATTAGGIVVTPASSNNGLLASVGLGLRIDHLGPLTGHFTLAGAGTFGNIVSGSDKVPSLSLSGGSVFAGYTQPLNGALCADVKLAWHFLDKDFALLALSVGISFGN